MITRDLFGNTVSDGDMVSIALSMGNFGLGKIEKISTGLDGGQPMAFVSVTLPLPIHPNGVVQGVTLVKQAEPEKSVLEG